MITVGIDEVGRGCWAGPLVAGAVILHKHVEGLKDSKKLSKTQRERLALIIKNEALAVGIGWVDAGTVDKVGISPAVKIAMQRALDEISVQYDQVIIDGHINYLPHTPQTQAIIKADDLVPVVSAASIVAKVARDKYMAETVHAEFPAYGFDSHVGYGTKRHIDMLTEFGVTPYHRLSYKPVAAVAGGNL